MEAKAVEARWEYITAWNKGFDRVYKAEPCQRKPFLFIGLPPNLLSHTQSDNLDPHSTILPL
jgi:hypothetical protein